MNMIIGQRIKFFREKAGLTQNQLAELAEISREAIGNYEKDRRMPPVDIAQRIASALEISVDDLIYPDGTKKPIEARLNLSDDPDLEELTRALDERRAILTNLIHKIDSMNDAGMQKTVEYVRDLIKIQEYKKP